MNRVALRRLTRLTMDDYDLGISTAIMADASRARFGGPIASGTIRSA
jgi:hypothetical protein